MSETLKPKRAQPKSGRPRSRPPARDLRPERKLTPREGDPRLRRVVPPADRGELELLPARIAVLEAELTRLREERGVEADEQARMLVRIAEAERARSAAEARVTSMQEALRELEGKLAASHQQVESTRDQLRRGAEVVETAVRRAGLAENSAADGAVALERARVELEADRARVTDLESKLARTRREHLAELASMRTAEADTGVRSTRALEEERSATARARQQAAAAESELASARRRMGRVVALINDMERRDEMVSAFRARGFVQARRVLAGEDDVGADGETNEPPAEAPTPPPPPTKKSRRPPSTEPANILTLDDIDLDVAD